VPRVDEIQIAGMLRAEPAVVQRYLEQRLGEPLDTAALDRDLLRAYGDGHYERVDYSVYTTQRGRNVLTITPVEKTWGPDYLRLGMRFEGNLSQGSNFLLRAGLSQDLAQRPGWRIAGHRRTGQRDRCEPGVVPARDAPAGLS
jgi:NTE family protein